MTIKSLTFKPKIGRGVRHVSVVLENNRRVQVSKGRLKALEFIQGHVNRYGSFPTFSQIGYGVNPEYRSEHVARQKGYIFCRELVEAGLLIRQADKSHVLSNQVRYANIPRIREAVLDMAHVLGDTDRLQVMRHIDAIEEIFNS